MTTISLAQQSLASKSALGQLVLWETLTETNVDGSALLCAFADKAITFQAIGTIGGATVTFQGSLDGTNWFTLKDSTGADAALTAVGGLTIPALPLYVRPLVSGGSGVDLDVYAFVK